MTDIVISGTGLWHPETAITNEALVDAYNAYVARFNEVHAEAIARGDVAAAVPSSAAFIESASGIKQRYAMFPEGIVDPERLLPSIPPRAPEELSETAELAVNAARRAIEAAGIEASDIDMLICGASTAQRAWPATGIEIQKALGCKGFAFDMSVACGTASFGISLAADSIRCGRATRALVISPEFMTPQINYKDRTAHFIFGDAATAVVVEKAETAVSPKRFKILGQKMQTEFSNNIRSEFGHVRRCVPEPTQESFFIPEMFFVQQGRKVFKELLPMAYEHMLDHLAAVGLAVADLKRFWLHQANINMNLFAAKKVLGREATPEEAPIILDRYGNVASAGSIIAFHEYSDDFQPGEKGIICAFGGGYSIGSIILERI